MIFIFILLFILLFMYLSNNIIEKFTNETKNSFCTLNINTNKCNCTFQKNDSRYIFNSLEKYCSRKCMELTPEECVDNSNISYYCNIGGECKKFNGTINSSQISANSCGTAPLNNQLLLPYSSFEECNKSIDVCDKYNIPTRSIHINKQQCLKDVNCGFCNNNLNQGSCISGTASGPNDLQKYYYCSNDYKSSDYKYVYGNHQLF